MNSERDYTYLKSKSFKRLRVENVRDRKKKEGEERMTTASKKYKSYRNKKSRSEEESE